MARHESIAVGGFYATPEGQVKRIATLLQIEERDDEAMGRLRLSVLDPCAGEGDAVVGVVRAIGGSIAASRKRLEEANSIRYAEESRQRRIKEVERARAEKARADAALAAARDPDLGWKKREITRAEKSATHADRRLRSALSDAGIVEEVVPAVAPPAAVESVQTEPEAAHPDDDGEAEDGGEGDLGEEDADPADEDGEETDEEEVEEVDENAISLDDVDIYTVEMECGRYEKIKGKLARSWKNRDQRCLHGDAFCVPFRAEAGVGLLYLNPPYDTDKVYGRLEERWLRRFTDAVAPGGVLVFIVPYYALAASAQTFATHYEDLSCYRFAGEDFCGFKQVVVFARKVASPRLELDAGVEETVKSWAESGPSCPELPEVGAKHRRQRYVLPLRDQHQEALSDWKVRPVDLGSILAEFRPWHETTRRGLAPVSRVVPAFPLVDVMHRTFEVATPPRPAHIAAGLAAGLFNGQRVEPDDPDSKLPALLVKGCFDREWRTIEEKQNKDGEKTGEVQVQTPKLVVTVLDLAAHTYHTLRQDAGTSSKVTSAADLSIGDLLAHYGRSLGEVMDRQCVVLYDPRRGGGGVDLCESPRKLFKAQEHAARGILTVLRERGGRRTPILIGEIGSGKSTVSLVAARSHGAMRPLVFCPPHLLESWKNEVAAVFPDAEYRVLDSISAVDAVAEIPAGKFAVSVVSREAAKLGHRLEGVTGCCPKCGDIIDVSAEDLARKRARCDARRVVPGNDFARMVLDLALRLRPYAQKVKGVSKFLPVKVRVDSVGARGARLGLPKVEAPTYAGLPPDFASRVIEALASACEGAGGGDNPARKALARALVAADASPGTILGLVRRFKPKYHDYARFAESLLLLLLPGGALGAAFEILETFPAPSYGSGGTATAWFKEQYAAISAVSEEDDEAGDDDAPVYHQQGGVRVGGLQASRGSDGRLRVGGAEVGSVEAAAQLLRSLAELATFSRGKVCGEPLYQGVPEPRRYPLARYIVRWHRRTFDFAIIDEAHEAANADSAQSVAAFRLTNLRLPSILMTGTVMTGYAESLFAPFQATDKDFQEEFGRGDLSAFVDRYGYRKRLVADREDGKVVAFGSQSDRVERSERDIGSAPGVLPLFLFTHLLKGAVTLQKSDLRIDLPRLTQDRVVASASGDLLSEYKAMVEKLLGQIKKDRFDEDLAGKLFGQLSEVGSYLDRATADVGNGRGTLHYEVRYPESVGGKIVAQADLFPKTEVLPKEALMLDVVEREIKEGRRVLVFGWHTELLGRLARLLQERVGEEVPVLYADKVPTGKRQAWIDKTVVRKGARVLVTNPVCVQTGLNNLVHFATIWQHENPACNPIVDRQSIGRIDRIGQKLETRVFRAYYGETLQEKMYDLLMSKVAISTATDGLDPESAMLAAGVEQSTFVAGLSLGKALWAMMEEGSLEERPRLRLAASGGRRR